MSTARIEPLTPPYEPAVAAQLESMMPLGVPPIGLFRTFARNLPMAQAMGSWGGYELSRLLSLSMRQRELVIDRVTARCRCEYEWGVHLAFFADRVGLTVEQKRSITHGTPDDQCWPSEERVLLRAVDELHDQADISDATWSELTSTLDPEQILDLLMLAGWYHAISYAAKTARVALEDGAPRFDDFI
jgi:alkylhydroperoxidase family enzyme